jgi:hypothetical protein
MMVMCMAPTPSTQHPLMVVSLGLVLVSCGATRYSAPGPHDAQELSRFVLVIKKEPGAQVSHSWERMSSLDLSKSPHLQARG